MTMGHHHAGGHAHAHGPDHGPDHGPRWLCRLHALLGLALTLFLLVHLGVNLLAVDASAYGAAVSSLRRWPAAAPLLALVAAAVVVQLATGVARLVRSPSLLRGGCSHGALGPAWQRLSALLVGAFVVAHVARAWFLRAPGAGGPLAAGIDLLAFSAAGGLARLAVAGLTLLAAWALAVHVANGWYGATRFLPASIAGRVKRGWAAGCVALGIALGVAASIASLALILRAHP